MNQRGPALVRIAFLSLVFGVFALALVQPSLAGTADSPEVQDPEGDVAAEGGLIGMGDPPLGPGAFESIDIVKAYVSANDTSLLITLEMLGDLESASTYNATFKISNGTGNATTYGVQRAGATVTGPAGTTSASAANRINFTVPLASIKAVGNVSLLNLTVRTSGSADGVVLDVGAQSGTDNAGPSTRAYTFGPDANDLDEDGIPDDCEMQWFNSTATHSNASADPDDDGLTIGEECALGTDPATADSDGDGVPDGSDPFPTDPDQDGSSSTTSTSGTRSSSTSSTSRSGTGTGTSSRTGTDGENADEVRNLDDAVEKLKSDLDYLGTSAGGMVAVLLLGIIALAVRWSL